MVEILDEISDDLRQQKLNQFWEENKYWIIGGVIASIIATGAMSFWRQWEYSRDTRNTSELSRLIADISNIGNLENFSKTTDKNHAVVAKFILADTYINNGEKAKAITAYKEIAETSGVDKTYRDLAKTLSIGQRIDSDDPKKLEQELSDLINDNSTWRYTALELTALLNAKQGKFDVAINTLNKITSSPDAPTELRNRAITLHELYTAEIDKF